MTEIHLIGLAELQRAVKRNPQTVLDEGRKFITRGLAAYKSGIIRNPWRLRGSGGGAPVKTGNLRDTHMTQVSGLSGSIGPNMTSAPYAKFVHDGTRRMQGRPWLEYVKQTKEREIESLFRGMLQEIVKDLAK